MHLENVPLFCFFLQHLCLNRGLSSVVRDTANPGALYYRYVGPMLYYLAPKASHPQRRYRAAVRKKNNNDDYSHGTEHPITLWLCMHKQGKASLTAYEGSYLYYMLSEE